MQLRHVTTALLLVVVGSAAAGCSSDKEETGDPQVAASILHDLSQSTLDKYADQGYTGVDQYGSLVWQYVHKGDAGYQECTFGTCAVVKVLAPGGCSSVYLKVNFLNDSGTILDWSNDVASNLEPGQSAILQFTPTADGVSKVKIVEARCT